MKRLLFISILFLLSVAIQAQPLVPWKYTPNIQTDSIKVAQYFRLNGEVFKITSASDGQILQRKIVSGNHIWTNVSSTSLGYDSLRFDPGTGYISGYKGGTSNSESTTLLDGRWVLIDVFLDSIAAIRGMTPIGFMLKSEYDPANLSGQIVNINSAQTLTNKTLTQPAIADYTLGQHNHSNTVNGGLVNSDVIVEGSTNHFSPFTEGAGNYILPSGNLGLGVSPSTKLDVSGTTKTTSLDLNTSLIFDGTTITDIQTGTGTNIALATKNYVDDQIISAGGYTDEQAQDAVGGALDNGTIGDIVFTYTDATPKISGEVENDSHAHTGSTISGLAVANFTSPNISNWTNNSNYLTSSYALTNDLGGTLSNPAVIDDSHNHTTATLPGIDLLSSGIVTITPNYGANTLTIGATEVDGSVSNEIQNLGYTASTRVLSIDGTGSTDATLPLFTSTEPGLVPLSGGGTSNFLRADGTWAAASGGSSQWTTDTYGITYANNVGIGTASGELIGVKVEKSLIGGNSGYFYNTSAFGNGINSILAAATDSYYGLKIRANFADKLIFTGAGSIDQVEQASSPATPATGFGRFYTKTDGKPYFKNDGGTEYDLTATATGMVNPMTTTGDIIYSSLGSTPSRLGIGTSGQVLTIAGGLPSWQNASTGFSDPMTTRGDVIYRNASNVTARLGVGTAGQVLTSNGTDVSWSTPSAGSGTVTSVGLSLPSIFSVTGSPVTATGTLTASLASQTANTVFSAPNGSSGAPSFRKLVAADMSATGTPSSTTYLRGDNTWSTIASTGIDNTLYATVKNISATGGFQLAHALLVHGDYLYVGERVNDATPTEIARIIKYDINTLAEVASYSVGANLDVESMAYDSINNRIYAVKQNASQLEIMSINPSTMALDGSVHTYSGIVSGLSPAIVTDGTYIYGVTYTSPSTFFKINISTWASSATATWTSRERGHAAKINTRTGYMYCTTIPSSSATDPYFAKVALSNLAYTEVNIGTYVKKATDDFAMIDDGSEVYCIVGGEYAVANYGGVQIKTSDLSLTGFALKTTYSVASFGNVCYSTSIDGTIQAFNRYDLNNVQTYKLNGYFGNELVTNFQGRVITTNFDAYDETKGKVIEVLLLGDGYDYKYPDVTAGSGTGGWTSYSGYVAPTISSDNVLINSTDNTYGYKLNVVGNSGSTAANIQSSTSHGLQVSTSNSSSTAILGTNSSTGIGGQFTSTGGIPVQIISDFQAYGNTVETSINIMSLVPGYPGTGIGGKINFMNKNSSLASSTVGYLGFKSTDVSSANVDGMFLIGVTKDNVTSIKGTLDSEGVFEVAQYKLSSLNTAPASATAVGNTGEIRVTSGYIYVCTGTNTWVRAALATW